MRVSKRFLAEVLDGRAVDPLREVRAPLPLRAPAPAEGSFVIVDVCEGEAVVHEVLAERDDVLASLVRIAVRHGLDPVFSDAARAEVEAIFEGAAEDSPPGTDDESLRDLTAQPFVTIDNADSRDLDQALFVEEDGAGHRVFYALADAAYYVAPGSALFAEALARGASYYLPGWMVPMLPAELSEGLVSLNQGVLRRALVFEMHLDEAGRCASTEVYRARIRSRAKLTYDGVQEFYDAPDAHPDRAASYAESLRCLAIVGQRRIADAAERDVVHHRRRSVEAGLEGRRSIVLYSGLRNDVERYNEQISLLCNVEGARLVQAAETSAHVQPIFRVHPAPPPERVRNFESQVERLAELHQKTGPTWRWDRDGGQSLAAFLGGLPVQGDGLRLARAIRRQAIVMNVRSTFTDEAAGHHGVGAPVYARFSSPMREVVGVFSHKELMEHLEGVDAAHDASLDEALRAQVIEAANRSKSLQSRLTALGNRLALDALFARDLEAPEPSRPRRSGTVMGISGGKVYVSLDEPAVEVKLYRADLERHYGSELSLRDKDLALAKKSGGDAVLRTGDAITVVVSRRDETRDRWVLSPHSLQAN